MEQVFAREWKSLCHVQLFVTPWTIQFMEFFSPEYWSGWPFPSAGDLPNLGIEPRSPMLQVDSLPAESQGKPKNTGVGRLSLLQWIFLTQESNWGFLHCRQILLQLSYGWLASLRHCGLGVLTDDFCVHEAICLHCTLSSKTSIDHFIITDGSCLKCCSSCVCKVY